MGVVVVIAVVIPKMAESVSPSADVTIENIFDYVVFTEWATLGCTSLAINEYYDVGWHWADAQEFMAMIVEKIEFRKLDIDESDIAESHARNDEFLILNRQIVLKVHLRSPRDRPSTALKFKVMASCSLNEFGELNEFLELKTQKNFVWQA